MLRYAYNAHISEEGLMAQMRTGTTLRDTLRDALSAALRPTNHPQPFAVV